MFDPFDNSHSSVIAPTHSSLGQEYLLTDFNQLVSVSAAALGAAGSSSGVTTSGGASPASTLVGNSHGLEINLIWDSSVASAPNWKAIESSVVSAAQIFTGLFKNHDVLNIAVGFGEVAGSALGAGVLGESASVAYLLPNDGTIDAALNAADANLVHLGVMAPNATTALDGVPNSDFILTSANAKGLGLVDPTAGLDGFIGLSSTAPISFGHLLASGSQYDAIGIAAHELSEVMGRISLSGASLDGVNSFFTPLDLFRYSAPGTPDVTPSAGYFSVNDGVTHILPFNDPNNGGDAADWATAPSTRFNAFDAFASTGPAVVTPGDVLAMAAIGWRV